MLAILGPRSAYLLNFDSTPCSYKLFCHSSTIHSHTPFKPLPYELLTGHPETSSCGQGRKARPEKQKLGRMTSLLKEGQESGSGKGLMHERSNSHQKASSSRSAFNRVDEASSKHRRQKKRSREEKEGRARHYLRCGSSGFHQPYSRSPTRTRCFVAPPRKATWVSK